LASKFDSGFVHQEHLRLAHDGSRKRDTLSLPARQLFGQAVQQVLDFQHLGDLAHAGVDALFDSARLAEVRQLPQRALQLAQAQPEGDVVVHAHVGVQRVVLEHHRDVAVARRDIVHAPLADVNLACGGVFQPRQHAQRGRLAAARRSHQHHKLAWLDVQRQVVDRRHRAEALGHLLEAYTLCGHCSPVFLRQ
jgi:hypothetical protein